MAMYILMTYFAYWDNIKSVFWFVTGMMILFSLFGAIMTFQNIRTEQLANFDSVGYSVTSFTPFGMSNNVAFLGIFAFFALLMALSVGFAFFSFSIFLYRFTISQSTFFGFLIFPNRNLSANFTRIFKSIFIFSIFVKIRNRFDLFAITASFYYDCFSHSLFPYKRLWLKPYAEPISVCGLSIIKEWIFDVK